MKKNVISLAILTVSLIFFSSPAFCQTNHNQHLKHPPKVVKQKVIVSPKYSNPQYLSVKNTNKNKYKKAYYHKYNYGQQKRLANKNNVYRYPTSYNRHINPYTYQYNTSRISNNYRYQPTLLERIFNL